MTSKEDSRNVSRGDRLLVGISAGSRPPFSSGVLGARTPNNPLPPELAEQIAARLAETSRLRAGLLQAGISEDDLGNPEGVAIDHLSEEEREQFNDAVREQREFRDEVERDFRELREAREVIGQKPEDTASARFLTGAGENDERV